MHLFYVINLPQIVPTLCFVNHLLTVAENRCVTSEQTSSCLLISSLNYVTYCMCQLKENNWLNVHAKTVILFLTLLAKG